LFSILTSAICPVLL